MRAAALVLGLLLAGCRETSGPSGVSRCPQSSPTANLGCAVVAGTVRGLDGQPIAGALVTLAPPTGEAAVYDEPATTSGSLGEFRVDIHRYDAPSPVPAEDTVLLYLRATLQLDPPVSDSTPVPVIFVPVDSVAKVVQAELVFGAGG